MASMKKGESMNHEDIAREREERIRKQEILDLQNVLSTLSGRTLLWRLIGHCGIYKSPEGHNLDLSRQVGHQDIGRYILGIVADADQEGLFKMMQEAKERQTAIELEIDLEVGF